MRSALILAGTAALVVAHPPGSGSCAADNCYRDVINTKYGEYVAGSLCKNLLGPDPSPLPYVWAEACQGDVKRVSSACSCVLQSATKTASSSTARVTGAPSVSATATTSGAKPTTAADDDDQCEEDGPWTSWTSVSVSKTSSGVPSKTTTGAYPTGTGPGDEDDECESDEPVSSATSTKVHATGPRTSAFSNSTAVISRPPVPAITSAVPLTTSTVYTTKVNTVTACPPTVKDCPLKDKVTSVVTSVIAVSTTVCPVSATGSGPVPTHPAGSYKPSGPAGGAKASITASASLTTRTTTATSYTTKTVTLTKCKAGGVSCPSSDQTTAVVTSTYPISTYTGTAVPTSGAFKPPFAAAGNGTIPLGTGYGIMKPVPTSQIPKPLVPANNGTVPAAPAQPSAAPSKPVSSPPPIGTFPVATAGASRVVDASFGMVIAAAIAVYFQ